MVWSSLAVAWLVILVLNLAAREPETAALAGQVTLSPSVLRQALGQRQQALADLALAPASPVPSSSKRSVTAPRTQKSEHMLKT